MDRFPEELDDLLTPRGRRLLDDPPRLESLIAKKRSPLIVLDGVIADGVARECIRLLDDVMYPALRRMHFPIPKDALTGMKQNYSERLPKTVRVRTATFNSPRSRVLAAARECGLAQMMMSKSFRRVRAIPRP